MSSFSLKGLFGISNIYLRVTLELVSYGVRFCTSSGRNWLDRDKLVKSGGVMS